MIYQVYPIITLASPLLLVTWPTTKKYQKTHNIRGDMERSDRMENIALNRIIPRLLVEVQHQDLFYLGFHHLTRISFFSNRRLSKRMNVSR